MMEHSFWKWMGAGVILVMAFVFIPERDRAMGQSVNMANFEYKFYRMDFRNMDKYNEYQRIKKKHPNVAEARVKFLEFLANHMAKSGWEVVQIDNPLRSSIAHMYFRRPKP